MRVALVITTINVPHVLRLYRRHDPDVRFFIATDDKTPVRIAGFCDEIGNAEHVKRGWPEWKCSELIGWNCIQRRNIAILEALRWGADIIVFVDDDNIPTTRGYFDLYKQNFVDYRAVITHGVLPSLVSPKDHPLLWSGLLVSPEVPWFDIGQFLSPPTPHRGYPSELIGQQPRLSHVVDARIGASAGIVLGDPDTTALWRRTYAPHVLHASPLLNAGIAVNPTHTRTVFNTQNSAVLREFAPAMLLCPQFKRYDDIVASFVCQRVMAETNHHVLFGPPAVYQERNAHDIGRDIADEAWGQVNITKVQEALWGIRELAGTTRQQALACYWGLDHMMPGVGKLADAWCDDVEVAMS